MRPSADDGCAQKAARDLLPHGCGCSDESAWQKCRRENTPPQISPQDDGRIRPANARRFRQSKKPAALPTQLRHRKEIPADGMNTRILPAGRPSNRLRLTKTTNQRRWNAARSEGGKNDPLRIRSLMQPTALGQPPKIDAQRTEYVLRGFQVNSDCIE